MDEPSQPTFRYDFTVELVKTSVDSAENGDDSVLRAMLVSTGKDSAVSEMSEEAKRGRIRFLIKNRHMTPFEHNSMTFRSEAPIFVYREWHRHRIGVSINEMSGRYTELPGTFYIPPPHRPLVQVGKPGDYTYVSGTEEQYEWLVRTMKFQAQQQYFWYQEALRRGYAKEVARMWLGVNIYSSMYWTCNARSLMSFLSLRTRSAPYLQEVETSDEDLLGEDLFRKAPGGAMFPSGPMWEIEASARAMEKVFKTLFPLTYAAWNELGRVS